MEGKGQDRLISPDGAGYSFNRRAWAEAAREGLDHRVLKRLGIFKRPVTVQELWNTISVVEAIPYTEEEITESLKRLEGQGSVKADEGRYALAGSRDGI